MVQKSLKKNALLNVIKQLCQVLFPLISIPYITRVLQPEYYGKFNYGSSIVSYFMLLAALGISAYSVREGVAYRDNKKEFEEFASELFSINVISTVVSYIILAGLLMLPSMEPYRKLIAIQSIVIILTTVGTDWINVIYEDFVYITIRYITFQAIAIVLMFLLVHKPEDYIIYALIVVGATAGANVLNAFHVRKYADIRFTFRIDWKRHMPPIMIFFANIMAITVYVNSDITMLGIMRGDREVGIYTLASKIYTVVKQIINAIIVVAVPRLSMLIKNNNKVQFDSLAIRIQKLLILLLLPSIVGVAFLSTDIIKLAGGGLYTSGATTLSLLSVAMGFSLLATFYTSCIMVPLQLEKHVLKATFISALVNVALNLVFIPWLGAEGAATTTILSEAIVFCMGCYYSLRCRRIIIEAEFICKALLGSGIVAATCFMMNQVQIGYVIRLLLTVITSAILYYLSELIMRNQFVIDETKKLVTSIKEKVR